MCKCNDCTCLNYKTWHQYTKNKSCPSPSFPLIDPFSEEHTWYIMNKFTERVLKNHFQNKLLVWQESSENKFRLNFSPKYSAKHKWGCRWKNIIFVMNESKGLRVIRNIFAFILWRHGEKTCWKQMLTDNSRINCFLL